MKRYQIDGPDKLKEVATLMKDPKSVRAVNNLAAVWGIAARQGKPDAFVAYIDFSRRPVLYRISHGKPVDMGEMIFVSTRKFIQDLREVPLE